MMHAMEQPMKYDQMTKEEKAEHEMYEANEDVRTMIEAGEIKRDKKRYARFMKRVKEQQAALKDDASLEFEHFVTLPTESCITELRKDGDDLIAETVDGEVFRIDTERRVIRAN